MRKLYFAQQSVILCRKCLNLSYASQQLRPSKRDDYMAQKISSQIKDKGGDPTSYQKPPRISRRTFDQLRNKLHYYDHMEKHESNKELRKWHGSEMEPYLDQYFDYKPPRDWPTRHTANQVAQAT